MKQRMSLKTQRELTNYQRKKNTQMLNKIQDKGTYICIYIFFS